MSGHTSWKSVLCLVAVAALLAAIVEAQSTQPEKKHGHAARKPPEVYEDREIKVRIPRGWRMLSNEDQGPPGRLLLGKNHYRLSLAYDTGQASGIIGGRFIEIFSIPWPGIEDAWTCSGYLEQDSWPVGRHLIFVNVIVNTGDAKVRENCAIPKPLGTWMEKDGQKEFDFGDRRWFGGYFTTEEHGYFFGGSDNGCGEKAYTLTAQATTPEQLPIADIPSQDNNPELEKTIQEAIDIVDSIYYKQCSPF